MKRYKCIVIVAGLFFLLIYSRIVLAHAPHDEISDVLGIRTPDGIEILTIVRGNLFLSMDGINFYRIVRGLDNIGMLNHLVNSASEKRYVFMSTQNDGIYFSSDYGRSWQKRNNGLTERNINQIYISDTRPGVIIAAGSNRGLFISNNWGNEWAQIKSFGRKINSLKMISDTIILADDRGNIIAADINDFIPELIFTLPKEYGTILSMDVSPQLTNGALYLGTEHGLLYIEQKPKSCIRRITKLPEKSIIDVKYDKDYPINNTLYVLFSKEGFFITKDNGVTWHRSCKGLSTDIQATQYSRPDFSGFRIFTVNDREWIFICGFDGLFRSENSGEQWEQLNTLSENLVVGLDVSDNYDVDSTLTYLTYLKGPVRSVNKGNTWKSLLTKNNTLIHLANRGFIRLMDLKFIPDSTRSFYTITRSKIYKIKGSDDSWTGCQLFENRSRIVEKVKKIITRREENSALLIENIDYSSDLLLFTKYAAIYVYSPVDCNKTLVANVNAPVTSVSVSPDYLSDSLLYVGTDRGLFKVVGKKIIKIGFQGFDNILVKVSPQLPHDSVLFVATFSGLFKSADIGSSWSKLRISGLPENTPVNAIALSPNYDSDKILLIAVKGYGLFKSDDGGNTFHSIDDGLVENNYSFSPLDYFPANSGSIKFSPTCKSDSTVFAYSDRSVFRSEDMGETWTKLPDYNFTVTRGFMITCIGRIYYFRYDLLITIISLMVAIKIFLEIKKKWKAGLK